MSNKQENKNLEKITIISILSKIFYGFSALTMIGMFMYLADFKILKNMEFMSIQFFIVCSYFGSAFMFFSIAELFNVVNRIDKNTSKNNFEII